MQVGAKTDRFYLMEPTTSHFEPNQSSLDQHWLQTCQQHVAPQRRWVHLSLGRTEQREQSRLEGGAFGGGGWEGEGVWAKKKKKVRDIILHYPAGTRWWRCGEMPWQRHERKLPWQHHSNCGLICSLVVWYSPDLLQWHGRQIHTSVTSALVNIVHELVHQLIDHRHHRRHHHQQQQSVRRSKNTVSTGLCFFAKWVTDRGVSRW